MDAGGNPSGLENNGRATSNGQTQPPSEGVPDIERILAELAGYSGSNNASQPALVAHSLPTHHVPQHLASPSTAHNAHAVSAAQQHRVTPPAQSRSPMIDPAAIFEWPQALRCVNKLSATNPQFGPKIKEMIADQDNNVKQWWQNRNSIIANQKTRNEGIRGLNAMLKVVGGKSKPETTPEEDKAELDRFDLKVYNASQQMAKAHSATLKGLGVPFFGVNPKHIIANELQQTAASRNPLSEAMITEVELVELQRKMVQYLEDMYKD